MKVLKSNWFRIILYIVGYISIIFAILGLASLFVRLATFDSSEDFSKVFEESNSVKTSLKMEAENLQSEAKLDKETTDLELSDALLEIYDYSDLKPEKMNVSELLDEGYELEALKYYTSADGGTDSIYCAYPDTSDTPKDNKFIRMTWGDYQSLVKNTCERVSFATFYDEYGNSDYDLEQNYLEELGVSEGDYCGYIKDKMYLYQPENNLIYYEPLGYLSIPEYIEKKDYVYFPYDPKVDQKDLGEYILSSRMYRSDVELYYAFLPDESKSKLQNNPSDYHYFSSTCNSAYSLDGKKINTCLLACSEGMESVMQDADNNYNYSFPELVELFKKNSDIFIRYDAKSGKLEQWYKDKSGNQVPCEYISETELKSLTKDCNEDFMIGINETSRSSTYLDNKVVYDICRTFDYPIWIVVMAVILFLACVVLLIVAEPAKMLAVDKAPYIVWFSIYGLIILCGVGVSGSVITMPRMLAVSGYDVKSIIFIVTLGLLMVYVMSAAVVMNIVRRTKCAKFLEGFLVFRFIRYLYRKIKNVTKDIEGKNKLIALSVVVILANAIGLILVSFNGYDVIVMLFKALVIAVVMIIDIVAVLLILKYMSDIQTVLKTSRKIEAGELDAKVDTSKLHFNAAEIGDSLNNLGTGLSTAVENSIRDERTKAELITNVSHDIKTPLTSIINYVDLLKKEDIKNDKANEYIDVLDQKSQRLKQLILDLIEASKTSTGNIELENINLNLAELVNQGLGEYEDRFQQAELELIKNISNENVVIYADGRRVFRIIDNLLNNAVKYAKAGTRVYVDLAENDGRVVFSIKNLSNDMLNISADELMERFVRGDRSRNTEGSGLGLSIAKNLTELQSGTFDINIDGDLFKVEVTFPVVK